MKIGVTILSMLIYGALSRSPTDSEKELFGQKLVTMANHLSVQDKSGKKSNIMESEISKYLYLDFDFGAAGDLAAGFAF